MKCRVQAGNDARLARQIGRALKGAFAVLIGGVRRRHGIQSGVVRWLGHTFFVGGQCTSRYTVLRNPRWIGSRLAPWSGALDCCLALGSAGSVLRNDDLKCGSRWRGNSDPASAFICGGYWLRIPAVAACSICWNRSTLRASNTPRKITHPRMFHKCSLETVVLDAIVTRVVLPGSVAAVPPARRE